MITVLLETARRAIAKEVPSIRLMGGAALSLTTTFVRQSSVCVAQRQACKFTTQ